MAFFQIFIESFKTMGSINAEDNLFFDHLNLSSTKELLEQVTEVFAGLNPLKQEFVSFLHPINKIYELNSYIGYELLSFSLATAKSPSSEEQNNRMFSVTFIFSNLSHHLSNHFNNFYSDM